MAINLNFQAAPATPFAKESPEAKASQIMRIGQAVGGVIEQYGQITDEREQLQAMTRKAEADTAINARMANKFYYSGDELENTEHKGQKLERDAFGNEVAKAIPAYEAEPFIRKRDQLENLNNAASGISNWINRRKFVELGKQEIEQQFQRDLENSKKESHLHLRFEVGQQVSELIRTGNHGGALDLIDETSVYNNDEKAKLKQDINIDGEVFEAKEILVKPDWTMADVAMAESQIDYLGADDYSGPLDQDMRIKLIGDLQRRTNQHLAGMRVGKTMGDLRHEMYLDRQIQTENPETLVTESSLWQDYQNGRITGAAYKRLEGKIIERDIKLEKKINRITTFAASLDSGFKPAPTTENQKHVNDLYDLQINQYVKSVGGQQNANPLEVIDIGLTASRKSGIVPQQIQDEWSAADVGDAQQMLAGAKLYNMYRETVPEALTRVNTQAFSTVSNVAARLSLGVNEATALEAAIKVRDMSAIERATYKDSWKAVTQGKSGQPFSSSLRTNFVAFLDSGFDLDLGDVDAERMGPSIDGIPTDSILMYENMVQAHFERGNDLSVAEKLAQDDFKKIYSMSNINDPRASNFFGNGGNQLMAYAPPNDKFNNKQIQQQLLAQFKGELQPGEKLFVYSDATTLKTGAVNPIEAVFKVKAVAEDGTPRILGVWQWNTQETQNEISISVTRNELEELQAEERRLDQMSFYNPTKSIENTLSGVRDQIRAVKARLAKRVAASGK